MPSGRTARHGRDARGGRRGETAPGGSEAREAESTMLAFDALAPEQRAFLSALYPRSAGAARQGVPDEALIDALGGDARVTKRRHRALERAGLVDLPPVPPMTHLGRPVMDHTPRQPRQQTIGMTPHGRRLMADIFATRADTARPTPAAFPPASGRGPGRPAAGSFSQCSSTRLLQAIGVTLPMTRPGAHGY